MPVGKQKPFNMRCGPPTEKEKNKERTTKKKEKKEVHLKYDNCEIQTHALSDYGNSLGENR